MATDDATQKLMRETLKLYGGDKEKAIGYLTRERDRRAKLRITTKEDYDWIIGELRKK